MVTSVYRTHFWARSVKRGDHLVFELEAVSKDDLPLVKPGAYFYSTEELETTDMGQRQRVFSLRFRRLVEA